MEVKWIKTRKEITPEKLEEAGKSGKIKIRKGKSKHEKAKKLAKENR